MKLSSKDHNHQTIRANITIINHAIQEIEDQLEQAREIHSLAIWVFSILKRSASAQTSKSADAAGSTRSPSPGPQPVKKPKQDNTGTKERASSRCGGPPVVLLHLKTRRRGLSSLIFSSLPPHNYQVQGNGEYAKMPNLTANPIFAIQEIPGKGKGLIATRKIPKGTRILSEEPIIRIPEEERDTPALRASIQRQVDGLTPNQRRDFLAMHNIYPGDSAFQYLGIIRTNALPMGDNDESGIFLSACRINHACDNNAQKDWNDGIKRHTVHALRDIDEGEEITIYYLGVVNSRQTRQEALRRKFGFTCSCRLCSLPPHLSAESDRRLNEILMLDRSISEAGAMGIMMAPEKMLRYVDRQVQLYNEQGPDDIGLPRAFFDAAQISAAHGDLARARVFAERAAAGWLVLKGDDSPFVLQIKKLSQDPSKIKLPGGLTTWKTAVNDVPQGLDALEFEVWLWRREEETPSGQPVGLRNQATFPSFLELPDENDVDEDFFHSSDGFSYRPRRHWCFLAEIVDFQSLVRLHMNVKDVAGNTVLLSFHTEQRGSEIEPYRICEGYTVAILYAQQHAFMFSEPGIRVEASKLIKRSSPEILDTDKRDENVSRMQQAGKVSDELCQVLAVLVLQRGLPEGWME
ncbi:hypothetical protein AK830_g110 [Neonectria ditissima]|uniref:SET domain-containing protein n=1 Tax=Neonectria ditissima TaxID=78410 RepID=A0A0P7C3W0_9HYPO|nr:hypothetical protein AK830_g110 [Neonectria ditissima]